MTFLNKFVLDDQYPEGFSVFSHRRARKKKMFWRRVRVLIVHYEGCLPELVIIPMKYLRADCPSPVFSKEWTKCPQEETRIIN